MWYNHCDYYLLRMTLITPSATYNTLQYLFITKSTTATKVKVAKNKVAPPFRIAEFDILFGKGISTTGCLLDLAEETNIIIRRGAWYSYEGENIGQGRDNTIIWLDQNLEIKNKVESIVKTKLTEGTEVSSNSMKALNNNPENAVIANNIKKIA